MGTTQYRSIYAVIPAAVRYDSELRPNAKLLYGELSALAVAEGYCWASNSYLADLFGLSKKTVEALIKQLRDRGHIEVEMDRDPETQEVLRRKIWISGPAGTLVPPPLKIEGTSPQNRGDPPLKIEDSYKVESNNRNTPNPPTGGRRDGDGKSHPKWNPAGFEEFWRIYRTKVRGEDRQGACREWDKLKPDAALISEIYFALGEQIASPEWQRGVGVPYATRYLRNRRWEDVDIEAVAAAAGSPQPEGGEDGWD